MRHDRLLALAGLAAGIVLLIIGLWALPRPLSTAEQACQGAPAPAACRALVRLGGAPEAAPAPDLQGADLTPRPLAAGLAALQAGWHATAYRTCSAAAELEGPDRVQALVCAGRAALLLGWPQRAVFLAQRALDAAPFAAEEAAAHVLAGDALEAQRDRRGARLEFLRALDIEPDNAAALEGLRRCGGDLPPPPDLQGERDERDGEEGPGLLALALGVSDAE